MTVERIEPADPETRLSLAYVPQAIRPALSALWALDERLAAITFAAREPAIGQMRLVWWRDALDALDRRPPPAEPLLRQIAADLIPAGVTGADLSPMTEGWDALLPTDAIDAAALDLHGAARGERMFALAGRLLGGNAPPGEGAAWALADLRRRLDRAGRGIPAALLDAPVPPKPQRWDRALRPLGMLAMLARRDPDERQGAPARLFAMLRHRLTGG